MLQAIEKIINLALLQIDNLPELDTLQDKTIEVHLLPIKQSFFITLHDKAIKLATQSDTPAITRVIGYPSSFIKYLINREKQIPKAIQVEGDMHSLMSLNKLMQEFDLDWEEVLSKFIGDPATHFISQNIKLVSSWVMSTRSSLKTNASEYVVDELKVTPSHYELIRFIDEVDELRDRTERLAKKIEAL